MLRSKLVCQRCFRPFKSCTYYAYIDLDSILKNFCDVLLSLQDYGSPCSQNCIKAIVSLLMNLRFPGSLRQDSLNAIFYQLRGVKRKRTRVTFLLLEKRRKSIRLPLSFSHKANLRFSIDCKLVISQ